MTLQEDIGNQLKQIRTQQGKTQAEVARKVGSQSQYISRIERGTKSCSLKKLQEIAEALNSTVTVRIERIKFNEKMGLN